MSRIEAAASRPNRIAAASRLMKEGRPREAEILVADILAEAPGDIDALQLTALLALDRGAGEDAFALLAQLATQVPGRADIVGNLGVAHVALGRPDEALACFEQAVRLAPHDARRRGELARLLLMRDLPRAREEIVRLQQLANEAGEAELIAEGWSAAGALLLLEGRPAAAEDALGRALALRPDHGDDLALLATLLGGSGRVAQALPLAERAYIAAPASHERVLALAACLFDLDRPAEAERLVRRVTATAPAHAEAQNALARLLILRGEVAAGHAAFAPIVRRASEDAGTLLDMARLLRLSGDLEKALAFTQEARKRAPEHAEARMVESHLLAALGRFDAVWPIPPQPPVPAQDESLALVVPEGTGAGEVLLLARFARRLAAGGRRLPCHAEAALLPLLEGVGGLTPVAEPAPDDAFPLMALPERLGVSPEDLDAGAYLAVETEHFARWGRALAGLARPLIGIVWDAGPSGVTLPALAGALAGAGALVSLAFDARRQPLGGHPAVIDAGAHFADARDLSAAIAHLDLVCGTDGLALHMAGAMARPAIAVVPAALPWSWAYRDGRALWYPSVRVIRQARPGSWLDALEALRGAALDLHPGREGAA